MSAALRHSFQVLSSKVATDMNLPPFSAYNSGQGFGRMQNSKMVREPGGGPPPPPPPPHALVDPGENQCRPGSSGRMDRIAAEMDTSSVLDRRVFVSTGAAAALLAATGVSAASMPKVRRRYFVWRCQVPCRSDGMGAKGNGICSCRSRGRA